MDACKLNVIVMAITNYLYTNLSPEDFSCLSVLLNEVSKSMFSTILFEDLCKKQKKGQEGQLEIDEELVALEAVDALD